MVAASFAGRPRRRPCLRCRRLPASAPHVGLRAARVRGVAVSIAEHLIGYHASETISNAVRHGSGDRMQIFVCTDDDGLTVDVTNDGSRGIPHEQSYGAESGRGLNIVSALADRWGYVVDVDTKQLSVFFDFDIKPQPESGGRR